MNRRQWIVASGLAATGGAAAAARLAERYGLVPPDSGGVWGPGATLTYAAHRLIAGNGPAREFSRSQISRPSFMNGKPPADEVYVRSQANGFADWRLTVDGLVSRPRSFSVAELRALPSRSQITHLACEEGWSFIAEWTGVPLGHILELAGIQAQARYVVYRSIQPYWWDSVDMNDALHPQTLVTYEMNGADLPPGHGGPLRVRVPRQLGYKSVKYVQKLTVVDSVKGLGAGKGSASAEAGYAWYNGI